MLHFFFVFIIVNSYKFKPINHNITFCRGISFTRWLLLNLRHEQSPTAHTGGLIATKFGIQTIYNMLSWNLEKKKYLKMPLGDAFQMKNEFTIINYRKETEKHFK